MAAVGDGAMEGDDIAMVDIGDPAIGADIFQNMSDHDAVVMLGLLGFARQVLPSIALGELGQGGRFPPFPPVTGRILASVDPLPDFLCLGACRRDRPDRPRADAVAVLGPVEPVRQQEGASPARMCLGRREYPQGEAGDLAIPD